MKPTVISGGSGDNHPPAATGNQPPQPNSNQHPPQDANSREFPHFQSGFGFRPHFDDMFDDDDFGPHLRARMMRNPFSGFGGRFHDPEWESMRGRRRAPPQTTGGGANARGNIFDHIPAEFRNYLPENFGFHEPQAQEYSQSYPPQQQYHEGYPQHQQGQQQQYYPEPPQQQQYYQQQQQQPPRPKYCDASIQTENNMDTDGQNAQPNQNLNQHNLRNTMDFGQKSQQEGTSQPRSSSAPEVNNENYASAAASAEAFAGPNDPCISHYASTGTDPQSPQQFPGYHQQQQPRPTYPPPPPQRHFVPPQYQNAPQYQQYPQQQAPPRAPNTPQEDGGFVRHVPIFIEGRSEPVNSPTAQRSRRFQQQQQQPPQQPQQPPQKQAQPQQQQQQEHPPRPTPLNTQQAQANAQAPPGAQGQVPQTPQTTACINKIQDIQRDVLNLMGQVEQFTGTKQDKEYLYLDEMLTRNLIKLDTIDTDGKDSIRLARREAIKCIQASINVLEAKAEENAKAAQGSVIEGQQPESAEGVPNEPNVIPLPSGETEHSDAGTGTDSPPRESAETASNKEETSPEQEPNKSETVPEQKAPEDSKPETQENPPVEASPPEPANPEAKPPENTEQAPEKPPTENAETTSEQSQPADSTTGDQSTLEPPKEQIEKSSSEKENKPPGSPKKKIVRKVKKVADKKTASPGSESATDESATPPTKEAEPAAAADTAEANQ